MSDIIEFENNDPLAPNLGKICKGLKSDGKYFVSKLIKIDGDLLYFETKDGKIVMNRRDTLLMLFPYEEMVV
jgi:hypothetical protein